MTATEVNATKAGSCVASTLTVMSVTVDLSDELLAALRVEAERRGVTIEVLIVESVDEHVRAPQPRRKFALAGISASNGTYTASDADAMLAEGFGRD